MLSSRAVDPESHQKGKKKQKTEDDAVEEEPAPVSPLGAILVEEVDAEEVETPPVAEAEEPEEQPEAQDEADGDVDGADGADPAEGADGSEP
jgi:hypothetical protein